MLRLVVFVAYPGEDTKDLQLEENHSEALLACRLYYLEEISQCYHPLPSDPVVLVIEDTFS